MRKLFGNSSRGASGGRYAAGKQAERRSAPVQPDVQRPEADDERSRSCVIMPTARRHSTVRRRKRMITRFCSNI